MNKTTSDREKAIDKITERFTEVTNTVPVREKLTTGNSFMQDCIVDELGWIEDYNAALSGMRTFDDKTGVQPYVYLKQYDATMASEAQHLDWVESYYNATFDREDIFLYVYIEDANPDQAGAMYYMVGNDAELVMDDAAVDKFWDYIDQYYYEDVSNEEFISYTFEDTAKAIMSEMKVVKSTEGQGDSSAVEKDTAKPEKTEKIKEKKPMDSRVLYSIAGVVGVAVIGGITYLIVKKKEELDVKEATEKAREAEAQKAILNTPMEDLVDKELTEKYMAQEQPKS